MRWSFVDILFPHEANGHMPALLQRTAVLLMTGLVLVTFLASNLYAVLWQMSDWLVGAVLPGVVVTLTNEERADETLPILRRNALLDEAARLKAEDMAAKGYFAHYSPAGVAPWHWFAEVGYTYAHAGENLAVHFTDSDTVVEAWMRSPTHRANIVNQNYQEIGVGTAKGRYEGYATVFVVQLFGTPAATTTAVAPTLAPIAIRPEVAPERETVLAVADVPVVAGIATDTVPVVVSPVPVPPIDTPLVAPATTTAVTESATMYLTGTLATSSGLPASTLPPPEIEHDQPRLAALMTSPSRLLQVTYLVLGGLTSLALLTSVVVAWRHRQARHMMAGVALLCLMSLLFWVHALVTPAAVISYGY